LPHRIWKHPRVAIPNIWVIPENFMLEPSTCYPT